MTNNVIQTPYGFFSGVFDCTFYKNNTLRTIMLNEKNIVLTHVGELIPHYKEESSRRKYKSSVSFHKNGMIKNVFLENQQDIITPIGEMPAEFVTFYDTGELKRIFVLDGKISSFWSEDDERKLNIPFTFEFDFAKFKAMLIGICFYKSGEIRSITLYPNEKITIKTPLTGDIRVKVGFSLYESGKIHSLEPASPSYVTTPIGIIKAYDTQCIGINADSNSLELFEDGNIKKLVTSTTRITVKTQEGTKTFCPYQRPSPLDEKMKITIPITIMFDDECKTVTFIGDDEQTFNIIECTFDIR